MDSFTADTLWERTGMGRGCEKNSHFVLYSRLFSSFMLKMYSCMSYFMHSIISVQEKKNSIIHHRKDPECQQNRSGATGSSGSSPPEPDCCPQAQSRPSGDSSSLSLAFTQKTTPFLGLSLLLGSILLTFLSIIPHS